MAYLSGSGERKLDVRLARAQAGWTASDSERVIKFGPGHLGIKIILICGRLSFSFQIAHAKGHRRQGMRCNASLFLVPNIIRNYVYMYFVSVYTLSMFDNFNIEL